MAVDLNVLKKHPGRNPDYEKMMKERRSAQMHNRAQKDAALQGKPHLRFVTVPRRPNKYVPHIGAKQRSRRQGGHVILEER